MKALKWTFRVLGVVFLLFLAVGLFLYMRGSAAVSKTYHTTADTVLIPSDSSSLALGEYIARSHGCMHCHGSDLAGTVVVDAPPFLVSASNLTSGLGGIASTYTDEDWIRTIRHGVKPSGAGVWIMPSEAYYYLNDRELGALVAHLKQLPRGSRTACQARRPSGESTGRLPCAQHATEQT